MICKNPECKKEFEKTYLHRKYCSASCRKRTLIRKAIEKQRVMRANGTRYTKVSTCKCGAKVVTTNPLPRVHCDDCFKKVKAGNAVKARQSIVNRNRPVDQFTKAGKFIKTFRSVADATAATGASYECIRRVIAGKRRSAKGFIWKDSTGIRPTEEIAPVNLIGKGSAGAMEILKARA